MRAEFDSVASGDRVKKSGFTYYLADKTEDQVTVILVPDLMYVAGTKDGAKSYNREEFNAVGFRKVSEPPVKHYTIEELKDEEIHRLG